jgi:hypothetical protein
MKYRQIVVQLQPVNDGAYTEVWLSGCLPTSLPPQVARKAIRWLALASGWPVECVLCVDNTSASWWDWWVDRLSGVSERHLELRYQVRREHLPQEIF